MEPTHHWQVTVRAIGEPEPVAEAIVGRVLPLVRASGAASRVALAACVQCAGELTWMADWADLPELMALEASGTYRAELDALAPSLRVPPKRELWRLLEGPETPGRGAAAAATGDARGGR